MHGGASGNDDDVARSVKSEFDYNSKKKFTDVLGEPNKAAQLARLQKQYEGQQTGDKSVKSSYRSRASQKTANSRAM